MPQNNPIENFHMKFCKELLGVQKQTTNIGVLLELGLTPLSLHSTKSAIKNWIRITNGIKCNNLVITSYECSVTLNLSWQNKIKDTLSNIGMLDTFLTKDVRTHTLAFQRLQDIFHQNAFHDIKESSKLKTYSILKIQIGYENYLSQIQNTQNRISLTKFRLSNHTLMIETGRHQRIEKSQRFCPFCPNTIEDERHFLLQCPVYDVFRNELFSEAKQEKANILQMDSSDKFITILTNPTIVPKTAPCLNRMFYCREFLLRRHKNVI